MKAAKQAAYAVRGKEATQPAQLTKELVASVHSVILDPMTVEPKHKVDVMRRASEIAHHYHARIQQVLIKVSNSSKGWIWMIMHVKRHASQ